MLYGVDVWILWGPVKNCNIITFKLCFCSDCSLVRIKSCWNLRTILTSNPDVGSSENINVWYCSILFQDSVKSSNACTHHKPQQLWKLHRIEELALHAMTTISYLEFSTSTHGHPIPNDSPWTCQTTAPIHFEYFFMKFKRCFVCVSDNKGFLILASDSKRSNRFSWYSYICVWIDWAFNMNYIFKFSASKITHKFSSNHFRKNFWPTTYIFGWNSNLWRRLSKMGIRQWGTSFL